MYYYPLKEIPPNCHLKEGFHVSGGHENQGQDYFSQINTLQR